MELNIVPSRKGEGASSPKKGTEQKDNKKGRTRLKRFFAGKLESAG